MNPATIRLQRHQLENVSDADRNFSHFPNGSGMLESAFENTQACTTHRRAPIQESFVNDHYATAHVEPNGNPLVESLAERMDLSIGEASTVMGSVLTELMRRALRGGILQIGEQLHDFVNEKVESTIVERTPVIEQAAMDAADKTARIAATEVAKDEVHAVSRKADDIGQQLTAQIAETAQAAREATAEATRDLGGQIAFVEKKAHLAASSVTVELTSQLLATEKRVIETAHADALQQLEEYKTQARQGSTIMKSRIKRFQASVEGLTALLEQRTAEHAAAQERLHQEMARTLETTQTQARVEIEKLAQRVAELERPGLIRRTLRRLAFWRKK